MFPDGEKDQLAGPGIVYNRAGGVDLKLDVITPGRETVVRPSNLVEMLERAEHAHRAAVAFRRLGPGPNRAELAKQMSPLTYVRKGAPPTITIQPQGSVGAIRQRSPYAGSHDGSGRRSRNS